MAHKINAVHCETQEQWNFVTKTLGYNWTNGTWDRHKELTFINLEELHYGDIKSTDYNITLYTFKEWCNEFNHKPDFTSEYLTNRISFFVKYTEEFTEDLYNDAFNFAKDNLLGKPRGMDDSYEGLKSYGYFLYDSFGLNNFVSKVLISNVKKLQSYGVDNNQQGITKEITIQELKEFINYKPKSMEKESLAGRYIRCIKQPNASHFTLNKEYKIINGDIWKRNKCKVTDDISYCILDNSFDCFELLSQGYSPIIELTELPEKWCFCVNKENYQKFKHLRSLYSPHGYITSKNFDNLSWGLWCNSVPNNHTEISFETFEKYVLNKEVTYDKIKEPVEEEWIPKVGDWVYAEKQDNSDFRKLEFVPVFKIDEVLNEWLRPNRNESTGICKSLCRKALPHEIPIVTSTLENVGDVLDRIQIKHISRSHYPKTPKESFKLNKLPTKSWY